MIVPQNWGTDKWKVWFEEPANFPLFSVAVVASHYRLGMSTFQGPSYLVTWNDRHLNYLMKWDTPEGQDVCVRFPEVSIVTRPKFVRYVRDLQT